MSALVGICIQMFILSSLLDDKLVSCKGTSHISPCPEGYVTFKFKCYQIGHKTRGDNGQCDLARIESEEENEFVKGLMREAGASSFWIKKHQYGTYTNYEGRSYGRCVYMKPDGRWEATYSCRTKRRPVCAILRPCEDKWVGLECDKTCHCFNKNCSRVVKPCYTGCDPGWTGRYCDQEIPKPHIEHYCLKYKTHFSMTLTMFLARDYESLIPIDSKGHAVTPANYPQKYKGGSTDNNVFIVEFSTHDLTSRFVPNYYEKQIDETTFDWSFRLREQNNVRMLYDRDFHVRCNFSEADVMDTAVTIDLKQDLERGQVSLSPSDVSVQMFFTDSLPLPAAPLKSIVLGQPVKLALIQKAINASANQQLPAFFAPRKCFARSKDKSIVKQLSDANGWIVCIELEAIMEAEEQLVLRTRCSSSSMTTSRSIQTIQMHKCPVVHTIFERFFLNSDGNLVTLKFTSFGMPGDASLEISCSLVACYSKEDKKCFKNCDYPMNSRQARSVMDIEEPVFMEISSSINIR